MNCNGTRSLRSMVSGLLVFFGLSMSLNVWAGSLNPDPQWTPGRLCSKKDPDFKNLDYPEKIARCNRNVSTKEKQEIAARYGNIPRDQWSNYEFDHLIPLCAGGSNDLSNLWPEPIEQAKDKDVLEVDICTAMKAGTLKQADAVQKVYDYFRVHQMQIPSSQSGISFEKREDGWVQCRERRSDGAGNLFVRFHNLSENRIENFQVLLNSGEKPVEVVSSQIVEAEKMRIDPSNLQMPLHFRVKDRDDRFDLYLPKAYADLSKYEAELKISFDGGYPKRVPLECEE